MLIEGKDQNPFTYNKDSTPVVTFVENTSWHGFSSRYKLKAIVHEDMVSAASNACNEWDSRAKIIPEEGYRSVFDGVAFDPENLRSQAFAMYEREADEPIGFMTTIIAPKTWITQQRYFRRDRERDGVVICDFQEVSGLTEPDFLIIPAMSTLAPAHRGRHTRGLLRVVNAINELLINVAPESTFMELVAKGQFPLERKEEIRTLKKQAVGTFIPSGDLPFGIDIIGEPRMESKAVTLYAFRMGMEQTPDVAAGLSLGARFLKKVR